MLKRLQPDRANQKNLSEIFTLLAHQFEKIERLADQCEAANRADEQQRAEGLYWEIRAQLDTASDMFQQACQLAVLLGFGAPDSESLLLQVFEGERGSDWGWTAIDFMAQRHQPRPRP